MTSTRAARYDSDFDRPTPEDVRASLRAVLDHSAFGASERNRRFLEYVVNETLEGRAGRIKAYNIALAAFERGEDFDPLTDPIVRIEASRLRRSLEHYYLTAGKSDRIRIEIPKGSYAATFAFAEPVSATPAIKHAETMPTAELPPPAGPAGRRSWIVLASALGTLALALGVLALSLWEGKSGNPVATSAPMPSVIVFPYEDTSGDARRAFIARGLTYEVAVRLTALDGLAVFGSGLRAEVSADGSAPIPADNTFALIGSVRSDGVTLHVTTILSNFRTGEYLRSWSVEKALATQGITDIQSEVANSIAAAFIELCASTPDGGIAAGPATASHDCHGVTRFAARYETPPSFISHRLPGSMRPCP